MLSELLQYSNYIYVYILPKCTPVSLYLESESMNDSETVSYVMVKKRQ